MLEEKKHNIIIVDDDDFLLDMYSAKFEHSNISVETHKSGEFFLERLRGGAKISLILLDIVMPNMSGIEVLRNMRKEKLAEGVPVVMLTNQNDKKDISEAKELRIQGYIVKSAATPSEVVDEVINVIETSQNKNNK